MNPSELSEFFDVFGNSGMLLYACYFFLKTLKTQYEARIANLEAANLALTRKYDNILTKYEDILHELITKR